MILFFLVWFPKEPLLVLAALPTPPLCPFGSPGIALALSSCEMSPTSAW